MIRTGQIDKSNRFDTYPASLEQVSAYTRKYSQSVEIKGYFLTQWVVRLLLRWAQGLSGKAAYRVGTGLGMLLFRLKMRRKVAMINLDIVYGNSKQPSEKERIYRESMLNLGRVMINNQKQADAIQRIILANPELWLWIHKRWKNQPQGVSNPYTPPST